MGGILPIRAGESVHSRSVVVDCYTKRDREYVVNEVLLIGADGRIVQRSRTHRELSHRSSEGRWHRLRSRSGSREGLGRVFKVGDRGGEAIAAPMRPIAQAMCMLSPAGASITTPMRTRRASWGSPISWFKGCGRSAWSRDDDAAFGLGFIFGGKLDLRLVNVLWVDESSDPEGRIIERRPEGKRTRAIVEVWCEKADGTKTIVGSASAIEL